MMDTHTHTHTHKAHMQLITQSYMCFHLISQVNSLLPIVTHPLTQHYIYIYTGARVYEGYITHTDHSSMYMLAFT